MATPEIVTYLFNTAYSLTGSWWLVGFGGVAFFTIIFMFAGIDFRFALILTIPFIMGVSSYLLPEGVSLLLWIGIIGFGAYMAYNYMIERT